MSLAPQGPLPARVYWIRRGLLIGVVVLLVVVVAKLLTGGSDGADASVDASGDGSVKPSSTGAAQPGAATPSQTQDAAPAGGEEQPLAEPSGPCNPKKVTVTPAAGQRPNTGNIAMGLAIGTSEKACTFTFSPTSVVVKIVSGKDQIWTSQQCSVLPTVDVVARAAKPADVTFTWNGHRSDEDCSAGVAWALPGSYHVIAATLGGEPRDTQFELTRPPGVVITQTAAPIVAPTPATTPDPGPANQP